MLYRVFLSMPILAIHAMLVIAADPSGLASTSSTTLERFIRPLVGHDLKIDSAASCAATACHGGPRAGIADTFASRGSEYPLWLEQDPHARSWRTISGEKSFAILQRLNIIRSDGEILDQPAFDNCLACHNSTRQFADSRSKEMIREGVGCNSCHGPSERWKSTHYQSMWQSTLQAVGNLENGFVPSSNMLARARMCASCHVGDRDRDMNHDIIAAGHPPLYYEFTTYHQRLPKHWRDANSSDLQQYESSQWVAGQVAAFDASLTLLEARANKALPTSRWPDFASYECSSCHQQLRPGSIDYSLDRKSLSRQETGAAKLSLWNRFGVEALLDSRKSSESLSTIDRRLAASIADLERISRLSPELSADKVAAASKLLRWELDQWLNNRESADRVDRLETIGMSAKQLRDVLIKTGERPEVFANWESATQFYLASVAARAAWPDGVQGESLTTARELRSILTFESGANSQQSRLWQATSGFKFVPVNAGIQHWHAISSTLKN